MLTITVLIASCNSETTRVNNEQHIDEADSLAQVFYRTLATENIDSICLMFDTLKITRDEVTKLYNNLHSITGKILNVEGELIKTVVRVNDGFEYKEYSSSWIVTYELAKMHETIVMATRVSSDGSSRILVAGYHSNIMELFESDTLR